MTVHTHPHPHKHTRTQTHPPTHPPTHTHIHARRLQLMREQRYLALEHLRLFQHSLLKGMYCNHLRHLTYNTLCSQLLYFGGGGSTFS